MPPDTPVLEVVILALVVVAVFVLVCVGRREG